MVFVWVLAGLVAIAIIWAIVSSASSKSIPNNTPVFEPPAPPTYEPPELETYKARDWQDGAKASVSKNFGRGGVPTGVSRDSGGIAVAKGDDDLEMLKHARPFQPRSLRLDDDE